MAFKNLYPKAGKSGLLAKSNQKLGACHSQSKPPHKVASVGMIGEKGVLSLFTDLNCL